MIIPLIINTIVLVLNININNNTTAVGRPAVYTSLDIYLVMI